MPEEKEKKLAEVYGVSRGIPLTYVSRPYVDDKFIDNLTRDKHLVVFGGSKQGKTCLRKRCLNPDDYIVVQWQRIEHASRHLRDDPQARGRQRDDHGNEDDLRVEEGGGVVRGEGQGPVPR